MFSYQPWVKNSDADRITESLKQFYFADKKIGPETIRELVEV